MIPKEMIRKEIARAALVQEQPVEPEIKRRNWPYWLIGAIAAAVYIYFMVTL